MSATQQAAAPQTGMRRIPFPLESYQHQSPPLQHKRLLNWYAEQAPDDSRTAAALIATPGLILGATFGPGPIKAINADSPGVVFIVSGSRLIRQNIGIGGTTVTDLGDVGVPDTGVVPDYYLKVTIAVGPTAAVVCVPPRAYTCTITGPLTELTAADNNFPGATSVAWYDGYFVFTSYENNSKFFIAPLADPSGIFDPLDFVFSDARPNVVYALVPLQTDLWVMGYSAHEIWYDAGTSGLETTAGTSFFPFRRQSGGVIPFGMGTPRSLAVGDKSVFWVGINGIVYRSKGYNALRISTHAIEMQLRSDDPQFIVDAFCYTQSGHIFYCFTQLNNTYVYDCATGLWHHRSSSADGTARWLPSCSSSGQPLLGSSVDGNLYYADPATGTDNGVAVLREMITPPLWAGTNRAFMSRLEVEMELGGPAQQPGPLALDWSDDGGFTWSGGPRTLQTTAGLRRVFTTRLGSFRQRVFRLRCNGHATLYAIDADVVGGSG
jgi:hypothetical protein